MIGLLRADGTIKDLKDCTFEELVTYFTSLALERFVTRGGNGLKDAIFDCMNTTSRWAHEKK